jgi:hypothetical protein
MVDPLLGRGVFCFEGGVRGDVFRRFFGPNDFLRKQIKAKGNKEEVKYKITHESKKQVEGTLTLEWASQQPILLTESALGVMTGWRALLEYQAAGFSSRMRRVFIEQCLWIPELRIFCGFCAKGHPFSRVLLKRVPECV